MQSLLPRIPRFVIAAQIAGTSAPPLSARSADRSFCAISWYVGPIGTPKVASRTIRSVVRLPAVMKISRSADDQISPFLCSVPGTSLLMKSDIVFVLWQGAHAGNAEQVFQFT